MRRERGRWRWGLGAWMLTVLLGWPLAAEPVGQASRPTAATATPPTTQPRPLPAGFRAAPQARLHASGWPTEVICEKDQSEMVLVPAGEFLMGSDDSDPEAAGDEKPAHTVYLPAYYIDKYEVTNAQYKKFVEATKRRPPDDRLYHRFGLWREAEVPVWIAKQPVINVTWEEARDYCHWAGKRLPTEAEWEKAARGTDQRRYPWGNQRPSAERCRFERPWLWTHTLSDAADGAAGASPYGCRHMAGNVWEWCLDWYHPEWYRVVVKSREAAATRAAGTQAAATQAGRAPASREAGASRPDEEAGDEETEEESELPGGPAEPFVADPHGPFGGELRVVRGGGWWSRAADVRSANRLGYWPALSSRSIGFRGCRPLAEGPGDPRWKAKAEEALAREKFREAWSLAEARLDEAADPDAMNILGQIDERIRQKVRKLRESYKPEPVKVAPALYEEIVQKVTEAYYRPIELDRSRAPDVAALMAQLDPYSAYIPPDQMKAFHQHISSEFSGVGIHIGLVKEQLTVMSPVVGSPAYKAGIMAGDAILKVDDESTKGWKLDKAVQRITGPVGTVVRLEIRRQENGRSVVKVYPITRATIKIESILGMYRHADNTWGYWLDPAEKLAGIRINAFLPDTHERLREVLLDLQDQGLRGLVLDLRMNSGGLLNTAHKLSNLFIREAVVVSVRDRAGREVKLEADRACPFEHLPLVVLVNRASASASEIFAGAIQDHGRGYVVGERTWGKASVQTVIPLDNGQGGLLKLTTATYYSAAGRNFHRSVEDEVNPYWGVIPSPDLYVPMGLSELRTWFEKRREMDVVRYEHAADYRPQPLIDPQLAVALEALRRRLTEEVR